MEALTQHNIISVDYRKLLAEDLLLDWNQLSPVYSEKMRQHFKLQPYQDRIGICQWLVRSISNMILTEPIRITTENEKINKLIDDVLLGDLQFNAELAKMLPYFLGIGNGIITVYRDIDGKPSLNFIPIFNVLPLDWDGGKVKKLVWFNTRHVDDVDYMICILEAPGVRAIRLYECGKSKITLINYGQPQWKAVLGNSIHEIAEYNESLTVPKFAWIGTGIPNAQWTGLPFDQSFIWPWWLVRKIEWSWDLLMEEFEASRKRIFVDKDLVKLSQEPYVTDPITGMTTRVKEFNWKSNIYEVVDLGKEKIREYTPQVRLMEFSNFFKETIKTFCQMVGLGADFYSLVKPGNPITATQAVLEHREAYNTINVIKYNLTNAIQTIVAGLVDYWIEDDLLSEKDRLQSIYEVGVEFDDGIFVDRGKKVNEGIQMLNAGAISARSFLHKMANFSKPDTEREIQLIRQEMLERADLEIQIELLKAKALGAVEGNNEKAQTNQNI